MLSRAYRNSTCLCYLLLFFQAAHTATAATATDSLQLKLDSLLLCRDSLNQQLMTMRKLDRKEKAQRAFIFMSYLNYSDRGSGINFRGTDAYEPAAGKTICSIDIKIYKPFGCVEDSCEQTLSNAKKFGNAIHFRSREWQARQDILFEPGQTVNPMLFADTERLLWERGKYKNVQIVIYNEDTSTNEVDVAVLLQDRLSWAMSAGYSGNSLMIMGKVNNFFGLPNTLMLLAGVNFNKYNLWSVGSRYTYNNILGSQINFSTEFRYENLNKSATVSLNRQFFSLRSAWAFNASYTFKNSTVSLNGNLRDASSFVHARSHRYSLWLASAVPVSKIMPCKDEKLKLVFAGKFNYTDFKDRPFIVDRNYAEQFIETNNYRFGMGLARWDYYLEKSAFYIDIPEYFPKGISVSVWAGPQRDEIYGKRSYLGLILNHGHFFKKFGYLYSQLTYDGYIRNKAGEQMLTSAEVNYISKRVHFARHTYFRQLIRGKMNYGFYIPEERYFNLNDYNGIRGFYAAGLKGSKSISVSFESDLFLDKKIALSKGMLYAFCDMGWLSKNGDRLLKESIFQYGLGFGFRLRSVDLGLPFLDFQFAFYPRGKDYDAQNFQFRLYEYNPYALPTNNLFYEEPVVTTIIN
jgi:outer membrane protein assembly factor BamA